MASNIYTNIGLNTSSFLSSYLPTKRIAVASISDFPGSKALRVHASLTDNSQRERQPAVFSTSNVLVPPHPLQVDDSSMCNMLGRSCARTCSTVIGRPGRMSWQSRPYMTRWSFRNACYENSVVSKLESEDFHHHGAPRRTPSPSSTTFSYQSSLSPTQSLGSRTKEVHLSEARVSYSIQKLAAMESLVNDKLLLDGITEDGGLRMVEPSTSATSNSSTTNVQVHARCTSKGALNVSGPVKSYPQSLRNFWYPVAFSAEVDNTTMIPFVCFEDPWMIFRGKDGRVGCVQNSCAHRACPLHLGALKDGCIQCPYHGWEYSTNGECERMPSTKFVKVSIRALPCLEQFGMIWIWPGNEIPETTFPSLAPPTGFTIHSEVLDEDLRLVWGQQDRMVRGANVWNQPVAYDKLGLRYRLWRSSSSSPFNRP